VALLLGEGLMEGRAPVESGQDFAERCWKGVPPVEALPAIDEDWGALGAEAD